MIWGAALALSSAYLMASLCTCAVQDRLLYPVAFGYAEAPERPGGVEPGWERLTREIGRKKHVEALFRLADEDPSEEGTEGSLKRPLVVYLHGNGGSASWSTDAVGVWRELGYHVLIPEYRGYGGSGGRPGQRELVEDALAFIDEVNERYGDRVDARRLILHGYSLGGGVAAAIASEREPWLLVLRSTFSSMRSMARRHGVPGCLARDPYDSLEVIARGDYPVLITHGRLDRTIAFEEGQRLAEARPGVRFEAFECGHSGCPSSEAYARLVRAWHDEVVATRR